MTSVQPASEVFTASARPDTRPRTAALRWFAGAYLLILGISFLILPRGPIHPLHGLVWFRGPAFVLCGLAVLWLAVLSLGKRASVIAHALVAVPVLAVAAQYFHLASYGPAVMLLVLAVALAASPFASLVTLKRAFCPDALGIVLGLGLIGQGLELLSNLGEGIIPFGLQAEIGALFAVFGVGLVCCHVIPGVPLRVRYPVHLGAGATALALYVILALGYGHIMWLLNASGLLLAGSLLALPSFSWRIAAFAPDTIRTRVAGYLFDGALVPLLIAVPLVLAADDDIRLSTAQMAFGIALGLSVVAGLAGWWLARVLVAPLSRLVGGVERIAAGVRPVALTVDRPREVADLAVAVERMAVRLDEQVDEIREARDLHKATADKLQRALQTPLGHFDGIEAAVVYHSATVLAELGGDFYDVFRTPTGHVGILLGDVSGRGLDAAAQAVLTRASLRAFIYSTDSPAVALSHANRLLVDMDTRGFVTVFLGILDPISGDLVYSMAGHPPPVLLAGGTAEMCEARSPVLGIFGDSVYADRRLHLAGGEMLVLYTDGLTEAKRDGVLFGEQRLAEEVERLNGASPAELAQGLYAVAAAHAGGDLTDDVAVLVIRREGVWLSAAAG